MVFRGIQKRLKGHRKRTNSEIPKNPKLLHPPLAMMHRENVLHMFVILRDRFQRQKNVRFVLFVGGGAICVQEIISECVFHMGKDLFPLPHSIKKSCTSTWQILLCLGPGTCMLLGWHPILRPLDHSMQHFRRSDNSFIGVAL